MFFCKFLILVEGIEDLAYLHSYIHLMEKYDEYRNSWAVILSRGGKSYLIKPIAIAKLLGIPFMWFLMQILMLQIRIINLSMRKITK